MRKTGIQELAKWSGGYVEGEGFVRGVAVDSRDVNEGDLFVCLIGDKVDGHLYAKQAQKAGASALLVSHPLSDIDLPQILVGDTEIALGLIAKAYRQTLDAFIIAITGSNGKTSVKDMLDSVLSKVGKTVATHLNQNTEIGTFLNLFKMDDKTDFGIFEFGLDLPGDITTLVDLMKPDAALLTSLAPAHMMNFKNLNHIADEKTEIFKGLDNADYGFYQGDYPEYDSKLKGKFKSFGFKGHNDFMVEDVVLKNEGIEFLVNGEGFESNLLGTHQASNAAGVIALLKAMKIKDTLIHQGLENVALTGLRMEIKKEQEATVILDAYKSNPSSLLYALEFMDAYLFAGKRYIVLSEMVELGEESKKAHQEVLEAIGKIHVDALYTLGQEFYQFKDDYPIQAFMDKDLFEKQVKELFTENALILIKGSRSYALEKLLGEE